MKCCGTELWRYCEASEQDSNIVYGFHLIPIYNRAQFVDKTDPCCSAHAGRGECGQVPPWNAIWNATRIAPWHPFLWLLLAPRMLVCAHPGNTVPG